MLICVTNRKLCPDNFLDRIAQLAAGGVDCILLREKDLPEPVYLQFAKQCAAICSKSHTKLILNHFVDTAHTMNLPIQLPVQALLLQPETLRQEMEIGASVHSVSEAIQAENAGAKWLVAGHIFTTACKPNLAPRGMDFLQAVCHAVSIPVYAIGGITTERQAEVLNVGASGCCVMSEAMTCPKPTDFSKRWKTQ